jgi:anti-anti-sigma factor
MDLDAVAQFDDSAAAILRMRPKVFVVDLGGVAYLGSAGIGSLLTINSEMTDHGGRLVVAGAKGSVLATLKLVGFLEVGQVVGTLEEALRLA